MRHCPEIYVDNHLGIIKLHNDKMSSDNMTSIFYMKPLES